MKFFSSALVLAAAAAAGAHARVTERVDVSSSEVTLPVVRSQRGFDASTCTYQGRDLSALTRSGGYKVSSAQYTYLFNICGPIGQNCGVHGANDTAVCQVYNSISLSCGSLGDGRITASQDAVAFNYDGGDENRATSIIIKCDWSSPEQPEDFAIENPIGSLSYIITGTSRTVCTGPPPSPTPTPSPKPGCTGPLGRDWSHLSAAVEYSLVSGPYNYTFNVCKSITRPCGGVDGVAACQDKAGLFPFALGVTSTQAIGLSVDGVSFAYSGGAEGRASSITFVCDRNAPAQPVSWSVVNDSPSLVYAISGNSSLAC